MASTAKNETNAPVSGAGGVGAGSAAETPAVDAAPKTPEFDLKFELTPAEADGVRALKAAITKAGLPMPSDLRVFQFIMGRKMGVDSALEKYRRYLEVAKKYHLDEPGMWAPKAIEEYRTGKMFVIPPNGGAKTTIVFYAGKHVPSEFGTIGTMRSFMHMIWRTLEHPHVIRYGFNMIYLMDNFGWSNFDLEAEKTFMDVFQNRVPIRYGKMVILNPPWYFKAIMKMMLPFMKPKLRSRMVMSSTMKDAFHFIPAVAIPKFMGGDMEYSAEQWIEQECRVLAKAREEYLEAHPAPAPPAPKAGVVPQATRVASK